MNLRINLIASTILLSAASSVFAAQGTIPQQCDQSAFSQPTGQLTRAQVEQKLAALEAVGYYPGDNDAYYPQNLQRAERKVAAENQRDCGAHS